MNKIDADVALIAAAFRKFSVVSGELADALEAFRREEPTDGKFVQRVQIVVTVGNSSTERIADEVRKLMAAVEPHKPFDAE